MKPRACLALSSGEKTEKGKDQRLENPGGPGEGDSATTGLVGMEKSTLWQKRD